VLAFRRETQTTPMKVLNQPEFRILYLENTILWGYCCNNLLGSLPLRTTQVPNISYETQLILIGVTESVSSNPGTFQSAVSCPVALSDISLNEVGGLVLHGAGFEGRDYGDGVNVYTSGGAVSTLSQGPGTEHQTVKIEHNFEGFTLSPSSLPPPPPHRHSISVAKISHYASRIFHPREAKSFDLRQGRITSKMRLRMGGK
jgi:hypothetical protein